MNRGQFFKGMLALVGLQASPIQRVPWVTKPQEGEELCPLGHAQKPYIRKFKEHLEPCEKNSLVTCDSMIIDTEVHECATCGIVYVKQAGK